MAEERGAANVRMAVNRDDPGRMPPVAAEHGFVQQEALCRKGAKSHCLADVASFDLDSHPGWTALSHYEDFPMKVNGGDALVS